MIGRYFYFFYYHPIVFAYFFDQLLRFFLYLFALKYLLTIFRTPYQMLCRMVDLMTRPQQSHALCYTTSLKGLCGLGRLPISLITLWAKQVFIPEASHGGFFKDFAKMIFLLPKKYYGYRIQQHLYYEFPRL